MKLDILTVRHGQSIENEMNKLVGTALHHTIPAGFFSLTNAEYPLTELGRQQAREVSSFISELVANRSITVVSSPFNRAAQTAQLIVAGLKGAEIKYDSRLVERDFGRLGDYRQNPELHEKIAGQFLRAYKDPHFPPFETGETFLAVIERIQTAQADWIEFALQQRSRYLLFVAHGEVIRSQRVLNLGLDPATRFSDFPAKMGNAQLDHYSSYNPRNGRLTSSRYYRSVCLSDATYGCDWQSI